jgi:hypothetical protein
MRWACIRNATGRDCKWVLVRSSGRIVPSRAESWRGINTEADVHVCCVGVVESTRAAVCLLVQRRVVVGVLVPGVATGMTRLGVVHRVRIVMTVFLGVLVPGVATAMTHPGGVCFVLRQPVFAGVLVPDISV